jgi:hypothetical protein
MIRALAASRRAESDEQRNHGDRRNHQKLVVVDVSDDLRLPGNRGIERRPAGRGNGIRELCVGLSNDRLTAVTCAAISA